MEKLSRSEKQAWRAAARGSLDAPALTADEQFVAPTVEARDRYIRFASQAATLFRGERLYRPEGKHWKL